MISHLAVNFPTRRDAFHHCRRESGNIELFVPTSNDAPLGSEAVVDVTFSDSAVRFTLVGRMVFRRHAGHSGVLQSGVGLRFLGEQQALAKGLFDFCSVRTDSAGNIIAPRLLTNIPCRIDTTQQSLAAVVKDVSVTGAFIGPISPSQISTPDDITVRVKPLFLGLGGRKLSGKVIWHGEKLGVFGMGVQFLADAQTVQRSLAGLAPLRVETVR